MSAKKIDMLSGPLARTLFVYTVPIILTGILQLLYNAADLVIVGRFAENGVSALGAVGATSSLIHLITNLFLGLSAGASVTLAIALGARNDRQASRITHTAITLALLLGVLVGIVGILGAKTFLLWMKTPRSLLAGATTYLRIYFLGAPGVMLYNYGAALVRTTGDTRRPLLILAASGAVNVVLNLILVIFFGMAEAGVAIATVVSQYVSAAAILACLFRMQGPCRLSLGALRLDAAQLRRILVCGVPAGVQSSMFNIANVIIQAALNSLGDVVVAGCTAAGSIEGFIYTSINAFHQSSLTFTGQNVGAKNYKRIDRILVCSAWQASAVWAALAAVCILFAEPLVSIYLPANATDAAASLSAGVERMLLISATTVVCAIMEAVTGSSRGMGASLSPMLVSVFGVCGVRLIWVFLVFYPLYPDSVLCLYLSYPISWTVTTVAQVFVNRMVKRRALRG